MEVSSVVGYHDVNNVKARELLQPYLGTNGYYLLRPSSDRKGGVLCTICVTNNNKLMNYRLVRDPATRKYYIFPHTMFPNIQLLLAYYKTTPINADVNTLLLYPVALPDPRQQQQREEDGEDAYVIMERPPATTQEDDSQIPGLHEYLPKSEIGTVMNNYLSADGWYLLRPSSTSEGQLTLAVSHGGRILNFKINGEGDQFYIAPKKRFNSARALLDYYKTSPIRSKKYGNSKILLLNPIPVDKKQEDMFKQKLEQKVAKKLSKTNLFPDPLPEPWQEHYDERYKRCYYYNPQTQQSSWERPKAPPTTPSSLATPTTPSSQKGSKSPRLPSRTESMQGRPLPATPGSSSTGDDLPGKSRRMSDVTGSMSPRQRRAQQPLPAIPGEEEDTSNAHPIKSQRRNTESKRNFVRNAPGTKETPALPSKDVPMLPGRGGSRGSLPALPPKEDSPSHVTRNPNVNRRPQMPLPEKQEPVNKFQRKGMPSLPPKEPERALPQLPQKQPNGSIPPLPPKETSPPIAQEAEKPLPSLPPKPKSPSPPPKVDPPPSSNRKPKKKIIEYEEFPIRQPKSKMNVPPLPEKEGKGAAAAPPPPPLPVVNGAPPPPAPPTVNGGGAPLPPPPPPVGVPVPPPPPPNAPPSPNPAAALAGAGSRRAPAAERRSQSTSSEEGGRPFSANDLAQAKTLLKKRKEAPEEDRRGPAPNSGIAGVFANAIDSRMMSIRKAMVDSDSGESEFEDVDDDWDD